MGGLIDWLETCNVVYSSNLSISFSPQNQCKGKYWIIASNISIGCNVWYKKRISFVWYFIVFMPEFRKNSDFCLIFQSLCLIKIVRIYLQYAKINWIKNGSSVGKNEKKMILILFHGILSKAISHEPNSPAVSKQEHFT